MDISVANLLLYQHINIQIHKTVLANTLDYILNIRENLGSRIFKLF